MNKQLSTWKLILESLEQDIPVMLLYVLESKGSSPGRQGFFMAVNANRVMAGSIGGGIMEHKFVEMAKEMLKVRGSNKQEIKKQVHDKSAAINQSGMICSGEQTVLLYAVQQKEDVSIQHIIATLEQYRNGTLVLSPTGIQFYEIIPEKDFDYTFLSQEDWLYKEKTGYKNKLFIIGGGHCSLALANLMRAMDFYISIYDDRNDLKTMVENEAAHEKHFISDYTELTKLIPSGSHHYVVIMTFGYRTDNIALRSLMNKQFRYVGVLGSKKKMEKLFDNFRKDGISEIELKQIHTPIGISIKSQTPEEIAVSIAAEIINIKNKNL